MQNPSRLLVLILTTSLVGCDTSARAAPDDRNHVTVREGQTLSSIAAQAYGDPLQWPRIHGANPWVDPDHLVPGEVLYIPPGPRGENPFGVQPQEVAASRSQGRVDSSPGGQTSSSGGSGFGKFFRNIAPDMSDKTIFGQRVDKVGALVLGGAFAHALAQGFLIWVFGTLTFVRDITLKRSMRAAFQTEIIMLFTVVILGGVGLLMVHIGTTSPGAPGAEIARGLIEKIEGYLQHPMGGVGAVFAVFVLYMTLSMRFIPQSLGLQRASSMTLIFLAVLVPHLLTFYTLGQRYGMVS